MSFLRDLFEPLFRDELDEAYSQVDFYRKRCSALEEELSSLEEPEPITVTKSLEWFESKSELRQWLFDNPISERHYQTTSYDCDDFATDLKIAAEQAGYRIDIQWDLSGQFSANGEPHALNSTRIGNTVYIIEPQNDTIVFEGRID